MVLLVIPGIIFTAFYQMVPSVVAIESQSGLAALRRSRQLGKGFYIRNVIIAITLTFTYFILIFFSAGAVAALIIFAGGDVEDPLLYATVSSFINALFFPLPLIANVLIYYDMRVRKENYDTIRLASDLPT
jgi:hypothetical protein